MSITLLVIGVFLAAGCEAVNRVPNVRYLGMGYNAITGNPDNNLNDPGFAFSVLQFTWANNVTTSDGNFLVPDNVQALQTKSCGFQSQAATEFGARSYQQALSADVSVEGSGSGSSWSARFSASVGYRLVRQGTSQHRRIYTSARAKCIQYQLSVNYLHTPVTITSSFAQAVSSLPLVRDDRAYNTFINTYGTHFTSRVTMGAKMVIRTEFDELALTRMEEEGLSMEIGAQASFLRFSGGLDAETTIERQQREQFESMRRTFSASYLGSHPPSDHRWETWAQSTASSPYPVKYRLVPTTALFIAKFFPDMSSSHLNKRRDLLTAAYETYCSGVEGCGSPPPDRVPVRMAKAVSRFIGTATVTCPPTYSLASCGILNVKQSGSYDKGRFAVPRSGTACECRDNSEAVCVAWCSNTDVDFNIVRSALTSGRRSSTATCPAGYKVCISPILCLIQGCIVRPTVTVTDMNSVSVYIPGLLHAIARSAVRTAPIGP